MPGHLPSGDWKLVILSFQLPGPYSPASSDPTPFLLPFSSPGLEGRVPPSLANAPCSHQAEPSSFPFHIYTEQGSDWRKACPQSLLPGVHIRGAGMLGVWPQGPFISAQVWHLLEVSWGSFDWAPGCPLRLSYSLRALGPA